MNIEIKAESGRLDELEEQLLLQRTTRSIQKFDMMPERVLVQVDSQSRKKVVATVSAWFEKETYFETKGVGASAIAALTEAVTQLQSKTSQYFRARSQTLLEEGVNPLKLPPRPRDEAEDAGADDAPSPYTLLLDAFSREDADTEEVADAIVSLIGALSAYHVAIGGNGLEVRSWDMFVSAKSVVGA